MVRAFARGGGSIVTVHASTNYLRMINRCGCYRCPCRGKCLMAGVADVTGIDVCVDFTAGIGAVVAIDAIINEACMVYHRWQPGSYGVAGVAFCRCVNMIGWFASGSSSVVTTGACTYDFIMIHISRCNGYPGSWAGYMACATVVSRIDMRCSFSSCQ